MDRDPRRSGERDAPAAAGRPEGRAGSGPGGMSGLAFAGLGFQFAAALVLSYYLGQWLDRRFGTAPAFVLGGVLVGGGAAFYTMYRQLMRAQRRDAEARSAARAEARGDAREPRP